MRQALVIYDTKYGNTKQIAAAIAEGLGEEYAVRMAAVAESGPLSPAEVDLLVVGGPTHQHGLSAALDALLDELPRRSLSGLRTATFDTRYHLSSLLTGSAAQQAARRLRRAGCQLIAAPESFFIERDRPPSGEKRRHEVEALEPGEVERAGAWARGLSQRAAQAG
ncbi:MAG TPA: flavodoxin domain-containing protein [Caldilineaceae bacterium]|nr:flavodoxin domain-containing protein [Caldilineaceae bacterium]